MKQYRITDVKYFMTKLLSPKENCFDAFLLHEASITTHSVFTIDGHFNRNFYSEDEMNEMKSEAELKERIFSEKMIRWESVKDICFQVIKGRHTPTAFHFVFYQSDENTDKFLSRISTNITKSDIDGLSLVIRYDGLNLYAVTNASLHIFTPDRTVSENWDAMVGRFFASNGIDYE